MSEGVVTRHLFDLIARQVADHRLVVWYDPEKAYTAAAAAFDLPNTTVAHYDGSFFQLRHDIDSLLNDEQPPRLVVYVPEGREKTDHALIELEVAGVVMQPGQQPPTRNTRLAIVARNALRSMLGEETAAEIEKQVDAGKLSLADLNALADKGKDISTGILSLIFGASTPHEVALAFLNSDIFDHDIEQKTARPQLMSLLRNAFECNLPESAPLADVRQRLARHMLLTEFLAGLAGAAPPSLATIKIASAASTRNACISLAQAWRLRRDVRDSYVVTAKEVEQTLGPSSFVISPSLLETKDNGQRAIDQLETFLASERALMQHVEHTMLQSAGAALLELAESRLSRFWSDVTPAIQARWALIASAAEVLLQADRVAKALKHAPATVPMLIHAYAGGEAPWCLLDTAHRHMESRWYAFEPEPGADYGSLDQLIVKAEQRYAEVGSELAQHFTHMFEKAKHPEKDVLYQRDLFATQVRPRLEHGKTAYVWVDALRFEMARELCHVLQDDFDLTLQPALGTIPTITEIGMAALLPKAGEAAKVVAVGSGKLGLEIDGTIIKDRKDRIAFLKSHAGVPVFDGKLDDLLPKPSKKIRDGVKQAELVLITSQEIDELCEQDNIAQARRQMDGVLHDLRRGVRVLGELGITSIILAADHGHLFADEIGEEMKIDAPGGDTADLHRRVWVGVGGTAEPSYLRTSLASLGVDSELDIATPWTFACFKAKGGARAYFHGGLSPQEVIIPVVVLSPTAQTLSGPLATIDWTLTPGTPKLTTRFFSVQVSGVGTGLFAVQPPKVRVEIYAKGRCVSQPVSASYGFEDATGEVHLRVLAGDSKAIEPNSVTVMLVDEIAEKSVKVYLLDAASGAELARLDRIAVVLAF
jgi:PglZ domain